ncbi:thioesterase family protein [Mycobacterium sp. CVI_P3]|uniref:Thioesterase family protein n=1 Tax=Mycobacterium pinniadriaticum TaxID=2994102 RepID=A0ABT3SJG6_9MYCO|nr:thioesterase family protein [Mycobacterium pinniadriaticum]MCX2933244.1 thioesterase family protein [Mycobacterium pinniadriaticum]MCX2939666.1 thioesterase family protein [Mycobacterium pinniadriaticum]
MYPRFDDAMRLQPLDGAFEANLNEHWTIGPKIHGGVMLALCAKAAREAYAQEVGGQERSDSRISTAEPVAVSADFLSAPDPGPVRLMTSVQKRGRRIGLVDVALAQGERTCVRAVVTLGDPEHHVQPLLSADPVTPLMSVEPPAHVEPIGPGHPAAAINNLARGCDIRPELAETLTASGAPLYKIWVRPKDGPVDVLFALMCGDISVPVCYAVDRRGWAPTVQMTAYLRGMPADGWLRVACTTTQIGQDWFDEDHTVVDSEGRIIVQTRQLALVPAQ